MTALTPAIAADLILQRRRARQGMMAFSQYTMPKYQTAPHLVQLSEALERVERGELKRLIVTLPPRHGKSEKISIRFPVWYMGRHPEAQIAQAGYSADIAEEKSRTARNVFISPEMRALFPNTRHKPGKTTWTDNIERQAAHEWGTVQGGKYYAVGVGGGLTGRGFDVGIIDDPIKDAKEAESPTRRKHIWDWYTQVFRTRAEPDAAIIVVMTRWHDDDLVGRLLKAAEKGGEQWEVLHLKVISDEGEALWPERYPIEELERIRETLGSRAFTALYQGEPVVAKGNIIKRKWFRFYNSNEPPAFTRIIDSWDTAFKEGEENDPSAGTTWGEGEMGYYLRAIFNEQVEFPELKRVATALHNQMHSIAVLVEDAASGQSLTQEFQRTRMPVLPIKVNGDKTSRANAVAPLFEAGKIFVDENMEGVYEFIDQLCRFPAAGHDDLVDSTTQALQWFTMPEEEEGVWSYDAMAEVEGMIDL